MKTVFWYMVTYAEVDQFGVWINWRCINTKQKPSYNLEICVTFNIHRNVDISPNVSFSYHFHWVEFGEYKNIGTAKEIFLAYDMIV